LKNAGKQRVDGPEFHSIFFSTMEVNGAKQLFGSNRSSKYLPLCSAEERNSSKFATT